MIGLLLALCTPLGHAADVDGLRASVEAAAASVADARRSGERRSVIAARMRTYREAAEALAAAETKPVVDPEALQTAALTEAIARGKGGDDPRAELVDVLGDPSTRLGVLTGAIDGAAGLGSPSLRAALLQDVDEQVRVVELIATWDVVKASEGVRRAEVRLAGLVRTLPGHGGGVDQAVQADRLEREIAKSRAAVGTATALRESARALRRRIRDLEGE